jgi:carbon storage regulator
MLVLARKQNEIIRIDDDIVIKIIKVDGKVVRVGIDAPPHRKILRQELYEVENDGKQGRTEEQGLT